MQNHTGVLTWVPEQHQHGWIALRTQHSVVLISSAGLASLEASVQISSPLAAIYISSWKPSIGYLQWFSTYQMCLLGSAKVGNRPLLQLSTFSAIVISPFSTGPTISYPLFWKEYEAWNHEVKHSNFASQSAMWKINLCKNNKDSIPLAMQQDQMNDITKNPIETLDKSIHRDATIPIVASTVN